MSFAIVGAGNRKAWMLALPVVVAVWYVIEKAIVLFVSGSLLAMFWALALPVLVSITAWIFRRFRERNRV
jgi:hypothetical protein